MTSLLRRGNLIGTLAIAVFLILAPCLLHAQSSQCASGRVDYSADNGDEGTDVEQTVCLYYDSEAGLDATVETDNDSYADWGDLGSLWMFGVSAEAQIYGGGSTGYYNFVYDSGMSYGATSDTGGSSANVDSGWMTPQYASYSLGGWFDECEQQPLDYDSYGCTWDGPNPGLFVVLQLSPTLTMNVATSTTPSTYGQPVTFTAAVSSGPIGTLTFSDRGVPIGTGAITSLSTTNLLLQSTDMSNGAWFSQNETITAHAGQAPDGTATATQFVGLNNDPGTGQNVTTGNISGRTFTASIWAKAFGGTVGELGHIYLFPSDWSEIVGCDFPLTGSWTRVSCTMPFGAGFTATGLYVRFDLPNSNPVAGDKVWAWGPQLEEATTAGPYIVTGASPQSWSGGVATFTTSALTGGDHLIAASWPGDSNYGPVGSGAVLQQVSQIVPSLSVATSATPSGNGQPVTFTAAISGGATGTMYFYDDGWDMIGTGAISPVSATNMVPYSQQFGNSPWLGYCGSTSNMTTNTTDLAAPDGTNTATKFVLPGTYSCGAGASWGIWMSSPLALQAGQTYTTSVWMRGANGGEAVSLGLNDCSTAGVALTTSWQRYNLTFANIPSSVANCSDGARGFEAVEWNPNSTFYIWGAQTEQAASAGPYVATGASPQSGGGGIATFTTSTLAGGTHPITAYWFGNTNYRWAESPIIAQVVNRFAPTVTVSCSPNTITYGLQTSTCTAAVNGGATGTVSFSYNGNVWTNVPLSGGSASASSLDYLGAGTYNIVANYGGDNSTAPASGSTTLTIQSSSSQTPIYSYNVTAGGYDSNGNVLAYSDSVMGQWTFGYDKLNRLTSATASPAIGGFTNFCWEYDSFGNRENENLSNAPFQVQANCQPSPSATIAGGNYAIYNNQNQVSQVSVYDGAGDVTYDGQNAYLYDAEGRICAVNTGIYGGMTGYMYDATGNRVAKGSITSMSCDITQNGFQQITGYVVGLAGEQLTEVGANNSVWNHTNVWAGGKLIGTYDSAGLHFHIDDPLGTRRVQVNSSGTVEAVYQSLPFGDGFTSISGHATIDVRFTNDSCSACNGDAQGGGDRNLVINSITAGSTVIQQSDPAVSFSNGPCNGYYGTQATLLCNGDMEDGNLPSGSPITVSAWGSSDYGVYPHMQVYVDGQLAGEWDVTGQAQNYTVYPPAFSAADPTENHFTGKERDAESGNDYMFARYYNSATGRFMSPDPSGLAYASLANPQSFNLYGYVQNNPLVNVDPSGLETCTVEGVEVDCSSVQNSEGALQCPNNDCNTLNRSYSGTYGGSFSLSAGVNGYTWTNNGNGEELSDGGAEEAGLANFNNPFPSFNNSADGGVGGVSSLMFAAQSGGGKGERGQTSKPDKPTKGVKPVRGAGGKIVGWLIPSQDGKGTRKPLEWGRANGLNENDAKWAMVAGVAAGAAAGAAAAAEGAATGLTWWEILMGGALVF